MGWPEESSAVVELSDGSLRLTSVDNYATVTLAPHKQTFTAEFLCRMSENSGKKRQPLPPVASECSVKGEWILWEITHHFFCRGGLYLML